MQPKLGGWSWEELQQLNAGIDWEEWEARELPRALAAAGAS